MLPQLLSRAKGVRKVVNSTKYKEIPSTPILKWKKLNSLNSDTN